VRLFEFSMDNHAFEVVGMDPETYFSAKAVG